MATRSTISIHQKDGVINTVYCHYDGYYEYNGVILYNFYNTPEKVKELISHGSISSLGTVIGEKHTFGNSYYGCTFYHRDRGEEKEIMESKVSDGVNPYENLDKNKEDFNYIFVEETGEWIVSEWDEKYEKLEDAFEKADIDVWAINVYDKEQYQKMVDFYKKFGKPDMEIPEFDEVSYEI